MAAHHRTQEILRHQLILYAYQLFFTQHLTFITIIVMKEPEEAEDSEDFYQELEEEELATLKKHIKGRKSARGSRNNSKTDNLYK